MNKPSFLFRKTMSVIISFLIAVVFCSVFALLWNHEGGHTSAIGDVASYSYDGQQYISNMNEGISFLVTDKNGFNNKVTFDRVDSLVLGSSHVLAVEVMQDENMTSLLNEFAICGNAYSIAAAGQKFSDMVGYLKNAVAYFKPTRYVIIEALSLSTDINTMQSVIDNPYLQSQESPYNRLIRIIKEIPCFKPIFYGLQNWIILQNATGGGYKPLRNISSRELCKSSTSVFIDNI